MSTRIGSPTGRFESLPSLLAWLRAAPIGTVIPCDTVLNVLEGLAESPIDADQSAHAVSPVPASR